MLRKLSIWLGFFLLMASLAPSAWAINYYIKGDSTGAWPPAGATAAFCFNTLNDLLNDPVAVYEISNRTDSAVFIFYGNDNSVPAGTANKIPINYNKASIQIRSNVAGQSRTVSALGSEIFKVGTVTPVTISSDITMEMGGTGTSTYSALTVVGGNLNASGVTFQGDLGDEVNPPGLRGGPVVVRNNGATSSTVDLSGATFHYNAANAGSNNGVLFFEAPGNVDLSDTTFTDNVGWAVRYNLNSNTSTGNIRSITLNTDADKTTKFSGNTLGSFLFSANGGGGIINVNIGGAGTLQMDDAMHSEAGSYQLNFFKSGTGTWNLSGDNEFLNVQSMFSLTGGTINIQEDAKLSLNNVAFSIGFDTTFNMLKNTQLNLESGVFSNAATLTMGDDAQINLKSGVFSIVSRATIDMQDGAGIHVGGDLSAATATGIFSLNAGATIFVHGNTAQNVIEAPRIVIYRAAHPAELATPHFQYDAAELFPNANAALRFNANELRSTAASAADTNAINFNFTNVHGKILDQKIAEINGNNKFSSLTNPSGYSSPFQVYIEGYYAGDTGRAGNISSRWNASIKTDNSTVGTEYLVLNINPDNRILTWTNLRGTIGQAGNWNYTTENWATIPNADETEYMEKFVSNDAVIFDSVAGDRNSTTINLPQRADGSVMKTYISRQTSTVTNPYKGNTNHTEYGMRVSGAYNWTFNNGSINDEFDPNPPAAFPEQKDHIARLTFDGTGTLTLNNEEANTFHDGTIISGGDFSGGNLHGFVLANGPDSFGSGEYAGFETGLVDPGTGKTVLVQESGYGIEFRNATATTGGGRIDFKSNSTDLVRALDQRILVGTGAPAWMNLLANADPVLSTQQAIVVTMTKDSTTGNPLYQQYAPDTNGGAVTVQADSALITSGRFVFDDNHSLNLNGNGGRGGAIWSGADSDLVTLGASYTNNTAVEEGGAIYFTGGANAQLVVASTSTETSEFFKNSSGLAGGAIFVENASKLFDMTQTVFTENKANDGDGGAVYLSFTQLVGTDAQFVDNDAEGNGGAIYINGPLGTQMLDRTRFTGNNALDGGGGAIYIDGDGADLQVVNATFGKNTATDEGGAINVQGHSIVNARNGLFQENTAVNNGGAIIIHGTASPPALGLLTVEGAGFNDNHSTNESGGAIYATYTPIAGAKSSYRLNTAEKDGGAIYVENAGSPTSGVLNSGGLILTTSTFLENKAIQGDGGAIFVALSNSPTFIDVSTNSWFTKNEAQTKGGAIRIQSGDTLTANGSKFEENITHDAVGEGGAIYAGDNVVINAKTVDNTMVALFSKNSSALSGGAIRVGVDSEIHVNNARFIENSLTETNGKGGAIFADAGSTIDANSSALLTTKTTFTQNRVLGTQGDGGAIYLEGLAANRSTLKTTDAVYSTNAAGNRGGAIFLRYADADVTGSTFIGNTATAGGGGAIYYQDKGNQAEAVRTLKAESVTFNGNKAFSGGGLYIDVDNGTTTQKATVLSDRSTFVGNEATGGYGGAIAFAKDKAVLIATASMFSDNSAATSGGAIYAANEADVDVSSGSVFSGNRAVDGGGAIYLGNQANLLVDSTTFESNRVTGVGGVGGAIRVGTASTVSARSAVFNDNWAVGANGNGGAIAKLGDPADADSYSLDIRETVFGDNVATGSGGAVYAINTKKVLADSASFTRNEAGFGGAMYLENNTFLSLMNASVKNNTATTAGGGVYFKKDDGVEATINLGSTIRTAQSVFSGNGTSFYFDVSGSLTEINLNIGGEGTLDTADPFAVDAVNNQVYLDIDKTGTGIWKLGGTSDLTQTAQGTTVDIIDGTFSFNKDAQLLLTNADATDHFNLAKGTNFVAAGNNRIAATNLEFVSGTMMTLNGCLALNVAADYSISSTLTGTGDLIKEDANILAFKGRTDNYSGNVHIKNGTFDITSDATVPNSGRFTTTGRFDMDPLSVLKVIADANQPAVTAKTMNIELVDLFVTGLTLDTYEKDIVILHTTGGITGDFNSVNVGGATKQPVDYLSYSLGFLNDRKDYGGTIGLRWYSKVNDLPADGTFTLDYAKDKDGNYIIDPKTGAMIKTSFTVGVPLNDNAINLDPNWDGTSLTKDGVGTLILDAQNGYTGTTLIKDGELVLRNARGTGVGPAHVTVNRLGSLVLDFTGTYEKSVDGAGKLVKRGIGNVDLTGTNTNTGGTVLEDGSLGISKKENLGQGTVLFMGGTLRNNTQIDDFDRELKAGAGQNVQLDTKADLTVLTSISDFGVGTLAGGLIKTGDGMLTLKGANTYRGDTSVRAGTLKLDGSVAGDVRVSNGAAIGGGGYVGGNLVVNNGGAYEWFFGPTQTVSPALNVNGSVTLFDGSIFRPRTANQAIDFTQPLNAWTVLRYGGSLSGEFTEIDNRYSPFFDFELDYSVPGEIRIAGNLLANPKTLSDSVTTSLVMANRRMYRHAFAQLNREASFQVEPTSGTTRGQAARQLTRSAWFTPTARANRYASTFHTADSYWFESYGMQAGSTVWSNRANTLGVTFGYERDLLHNHSDSIRAHDYFLGVYSGHVFSDVYEVRSFLGTGFQDFTSFRNDGVHDYVAKYKGGSFEANIEASRIYVGRNGYLLRPFVGLDFEYAHIETGEENEVGYEFRQYPRSSLTQFFGRLGVQLERRWSRFDAHGGATLRCLLIGPVRPEGNVFYPTRGAGSEQVGARMGSSGVTLNTGFNWYLDRQRAAALFFDYYADMYFDNDGNGAMHTGNVGLSYRF